MYYPGPSSYRDDAAIIKIVTPDGGRISACYLRGEDARYTVLFSHGNAEDLGDIMPFLQQYRSRGFSVLAYDYPGYGTSGGKARSTQVVRAAQAVYAYLTEHEQVPPESIILHGRSLGGAVAVRLASEYSCAGLIVESSFVSVLRVLTRYPVFVLDKFNSSRLIKQAHAPVLIIHGESDVIIPPWHGRELYRRASGSKRFWPVPGAGHNDLVYTAGERYWRTLTDFAAGIGRKAQ